MKTQAVIFDLFGTLTGPFPWDKLRVCLRTMAAALRVDCQAFSDLWNGPDKLRRHTGVFPSFREELAWLCEQGTISPPEEGLARAIQARCDFTRSTLRPRPDAVATLRELRSKGVETGLISDCSREVPELWPETPYCGLLDAEVFSCLEGMKKPNPAIYGLACERLDVAADACVYIGDGGSNELQGARACGMRAYLLHPPGEEPPGSSPSKSGDPAWDGETLPALGSVVGLLCEESARQAERNR